ncbi:glycoside hydrolase family 35 protein [Fictibacillus fluitans]|uniref:Beta-galactosidase n=1 Tax=Fictibacillus fluitans TaxID=3058422 RepID=A0ABT8HT18_9BACL|nr:beta-galactosidase [Fictibacillus sp. NE201]MDN4523879.1 beta-galactosidase [Fictibacillus sp. NE201]
MLETRNQSFYLNGEPFRILSGAIHYFRVVPEYWEDRLKKLKACGLNTVETYIPWNVHEPRKGEFVFTGMADLEGFVTAAQKLGLYVILRPSPYICAEWEFGGLPAWLLQDKNMELRCSHPAFLKHVEDYYDVLIPKIVPYLIEKGGPVIGLQVENEYGGYGNDASYLLFLRDAMRNRGITGMLFTSDGPDMLKSGSLPDVLPTVNFGSRPEEGFEKLKQFQSDAPAMCMEYWIGWFDHWGGEHHTRGGEDAAEVLDEMLRAGGSINFYMFHGGTNFGFMNGANQYESYSPTITSYDYDALLTESGDYTDKYWKCKHIVGRYTDIPDMEIPEIPKVAYGDVLLSDMGSLFDYLPDTNSKMNSAYPLTMEQAGQNYGYILYKTAVEFPGKYEMDTRGIHDRAFIYVNGEHQHTIYRNDEKQTVTLSFSQSVNTLEILVENMGRVNYGNNLKDPKGITQGIWLNNQYIYNWEITSFEPEMFLGNTKEYKGMPDERYPRVFKGTFTADTVGDTFVSLSEWTKGNVFVNGFNLGRYWSEGPQETLYLPGPLLKNGENEIVVLELEGNEGATITLLDKPQLG